MKHTLYVNWPLVCVKYREKYSYKQRVKWYCDIWLYGRSLEKQLAIDLIIEDVHERCSIYM